MTDPQVSTTPVTDPIPTSNTTPASSHDFFWWSEDIFTNPEFVQEEPKAVSSSEYQATEQSEGVPQGGIVSTPPEGEDTYVSDPTWMTKPEKVVSPEYQATEQSEGVPQDEISSTEPVITEELIVPEEIKEPIFAPIEESQLVVEDVLPVPESVPEEVQMEVPIVEEEKAPVVEKEAIEPVEEIVPVVEEVEPAAQPEEQILREKEPLVDLSTSELTQKFMELFHMSKKIAELKKTDAGFELLGANNDKLSITYKVFPGDDDYPIVSITKDEIDKETEEQTSHELSFYLDEQGASLNVNLDDFLLFEETTDLQDDIKKRMQVSDKLNKFSFLMSEEIRKLEKELKEKEAEEQEKKKLQDIFRNF